MKLIDIPGIGEKTVSILENHGITTIDELLRYYPRGYRTYIATSTKAAQAGDWVSLVGTTSRPVSHHTTHTTTQLATFKDAEGSVTLRWFNMPYIVQGINPSNRYIVRGQLTIFGNTRQIVSPQIQVINADGHLPVNEMIPLYSTIGTLKSGNIRKMIANALEANPIITDNLDLPIRDRYDLLDLQKAHKYIHCPPSESLLKRAIKRLAFSELYTLQIEALEKSELNKIKTIPINYNHQTIASFLADLPFTPTSAQTRVIHEICTDLSQDIAMHRLLAGEVGSGKTLVAASAALATHTAGRQTLIMAPTQILAEQLYASCQNLLGDSLKISLVTANVKGDTQAHIVVGTQALLSTKHHFGNVGLVIVDEQHRFGVKQREYLTTLSPAPHLLMMTATPIPRTLAMTLFANMQISRLDELPKNRLPIKTFLVGEEKRDNAFTWIKKEITENHNQVFVVVPLIEEAEDDEGNAKKSLKLLESDLKARFPGLTIDIMHGKMKEGEKTNHLQEFRDGKTHILVATSMVEVGIDIPEANIMVIEDAERFGLASLHQLRGRVGRGDKQGYCLLFVGARHVSPAMKRLSYFVHETNGEKLASFDLENRGPGELFGENQHGFFSLRFASLADRELLESTHTAAVAIHSAMH